MAVATGAWFGRGWIGDTYHHASDKVSNWTSGSDDTNAPNTTDVPNTTADGTAPGIPADPNTTFIDDDANRAYLRWEKQHLAELSAASTALNKSLDALKEVAGTKSAGEASAAVGNMRDDIHDLLVLVDAAPQSQIRSDAVTLFLKYTGGMDHLLEALRTGSSVTFAEGEKVLHEADTDANRYQQKYGPRTIVFLI